jgi:hypothetical protein
MRPVDVSFDELVDFMKAYELEAIAKDEKLLADLKSAYRRYRALLVWHHYLSHSAAWETNASRRTTFLDFYTECVSDAAQSILIASQGMYKPAHLILRSAVENHFKCVGILHGVNVTTITNVFSLIDAVKETAVAKSTNAGKNHFQWLRAEYSRLCSHVHTANQLHMAKTNLLGIFPRYDRSNAVPFFSGLTTVSTSIVALNCLMLLSSFRKMHHTNFDQICDILPKSTRTELASL